MLISVLERVFITSLLAGVNIKINITLKIFFNFFDNIQSLL